MKWISFKDELPPRLDDILIWNDDPDHGEMIGIGFLSLKSFLKYQYTCFELMEISLKDLLEKDFYWMKAPEFNK